MTRIKQINERLRATHGERVSLAHFAPEGVVKHSGGEVDFSDRALLASIVPSLKEWVVSAPVSVIRGHKADQPGSVALGEVVDILELAAGDDIEGGLYAAVRWTADAWDKVQGSEFAAVSMYLAFNEEDHAGRVWPAVMRHLAVVDEPLFAVGQQKLNELAASASGAVVSSVCVAGALVPNRGGQNMELEQAVERLAAIVDALGERLAALEAVAQAEPEPEPEEVEAEAADEEEPEEVIEASAAPLVAARDAEIAALQARIDKMELADRKRRASELVASAVAAGKIADSKQLMALAVDDFDRAKALIASIPARSTAVVAASATGAAPSSDERAVAAANAAYRLARERNLDARGEAELFRQIMANGGDLNV